MRCSIGVSSNGPRRQSGTRQHWSCCRCRRGRCRRDRWCRVRWRLVRWRFGRWRFGRLGRWPLALWPLAVWPLALWPLALWPLAPCFCRLRFGRLGRCRRGRLGRHLSLGRLGRLGRRRCYCLHHGRLGRYRLFEGCGCQSSGLHAPSLPRKCCIDNPRGRTASVSGACMQARPQDLR